jgi:RimJ/RimL family protein N-acetyltransferase
VTIETRSPFPKWALPQLWLWIESFRDRVMDDFAPRTLEDFLADWEARESTRKSWGVYRQDELGGVVIIEPVNPVSVSSHVAFKRSFWGRETTVPALREVYAEVFESGVERISAAIFEDNYQIRNLALEVGAIEETRRSQPLRNCTVRNGDLVGMRIISLFPEEFNRCLSLQQSPPPSGSAEDSAAPLRQAA